jgi:hypothetical protein
VNVSGVPADAIKLAEIIRVLPHLVTLDLSYTSVTTLQGLGQAIYLGFLDLRGEFSVTIIVVGVSVIIVVVVIIIIIIIIVVVVVIIKIVDDDDLFK